MFYLCLFTTPNTLHTNDLLLPCCTLHISASAGLVFFSLVLPLLFSLPPHHPTVTDCTNIISNYNSSVLHYMWGHTQRETSINGAYLVNCVCCIQGACTSENVVKVWIPCHPLTPNTHISSCFLLPKNVNRLLQNWIIYISSLCQ